MLKRKYTQDKLNSFFRGDTANGSGSEDERGEIPSLVNTKYSSKYSKKQVFAQGDKAMLVDYIKSALI